MGSKREWDRRAFVRAVVAVGGIGGVAGCIGSGEDGDGGSQSGNELGAQMQVPSGGSSDGSGYGQTESLSGAVEAVNSIVEQLNHCGPETDHCLEQMNERLDNVEDIEYVENVEASSTDEARQEAQRLRGEIDRVQGELREKVPREINSVAQEQAGTDIIRNPDDLQSAEDFRTGAEKLSRIDRASTVLQETGNLMELVQVSLGSAADRLERAVEAD